MIFANNFARTDESKIILGMSDAWSMRQLSHQPSDPAYYIEDSRIFTYYLWLVVQIDSVLAVGSRTREPILNCNKVFVCNMCINICTTTSLKFVSDKLFGWLVCFLVFQQISSLAFIGS